MIKFQSFKFLKTLSKCPLSLDCFTTNVFCVLCLTGHKELSHLTEEEKTEKKIEKVTYVCKALCCTYSFLKSVIKITHQTFHNLKMLHLLSFSSPKN